MNVMRSDYLFLSIESQNSNVAHSYAGTTGAVHFRFIGIVDIEMLGKLLRVRAKTVMIVRVTNRQV